MRASHSKAEHTRVAGDAERAARVGAADGARATRRGPAAPEEEGRAGRRGWLRAGDATAAGGAGRRGRAGGDGCRRRRREKEAQMRAGPNARARGNRSQDESASARELEDPPSTTHDGDARRTSARGEAGPRSRAAPPSWVGLDPGLAAPDLQPGKTDRRRRRSI